MLRECAKFPNNVEEPGDNAEHHVCGVLGLARTPLPVLGDSPAAAAHFSGDAGSFPQADSCANLCPWLASTPAVSHLRNLLQQCPHWFRMLDVERRASDGEGLLLPSVLVSDSSRTTPAWM